MIKLSSFTYQTFVSENKIYNPKLSDKLQIFIEYLFSTKIYQ